MIGETLQHYKIVKQLGRGGMGEVYLAEDTKLNRKVALKILPAAVSGDAEYRSRFKREAQAVAALNHPNIVTIHAVEEAEGVHFLVMELVKGRPLTEAIPDTGLSLPRMLDIAIPLADAVSAAHRVGILHRDLKPENVMIDEDGGVKVLDFGLAKLADPGSGEQQATVVLEDSKLTGEGRILGTVAYMSPEQAEGKPVDVRSDVFSLGTMLYEMSTGQRPFIGDTPVSTVTSIIRDDPAPVSSLNAKMPRELARITKRCLAKNPDRRYESATGLRNDLLDLREELDSGALTASAPTSRPKGRSPFQWIAVGVLVASSAWAIAYFSGRRAGDATTSTGFDDLQVSRLTTTGSNRDSRISPDGRFVAHIEEVAGLRSLWVTQISTRSSVEVVPASSDELSSPTYSTDGDFLYYIGGTAYTRHIYRKPSVGGAPRRMPIEAVTRGSDLSLSPAGDRIAYTTSEASDLIVNVLKICDIAGQEQLTLVSPATAPEILVVGSLTWSPDGERIAMIALVNEQGSLEGRILVVPVDGGPYQSMEGSWIDFGGLCWAHDGKGLLISAARADLGASSSQIFHVSYPDGAIRQVTRDANSYGDLSITADGRTICASQGATTAHLWLVDTENPATAAQLTKGNRNDGGDGVTWMDDETILYGSNASGSTQFWTLRLGDGMPSRITDDEHTRFGPAAIDAQSYLFSSLRSGTLNIWKGDLVGSPPVQLTFGSIDINATVARGQDWFVYMTAFDNEPVRFWKSTLAGGDATLLPFENLGGYPLVSPDGQWLAFTVLISGGPAELHVAPVDGGEPVARFDWSDRQWRRWSADGKEISYLSTEDGVDNVWSQPLDGGEPHQITRFDSGSIGTNWAHSPDGRRLVVSRASELRDVVLLRAN